MSRSRRKTPITGITNAASEKKDKQIWHRRFRHKIRDILRRTNEDEIDDIELPVEKEVSSTWAMDKDGKQYIGDMEDQEYKEELMRK